jgi:hypothetical protein
MQQRGCVRPTRKPPELKLKPPWPSKGEERKAEQGIALINAAINVNAAQQNNEYTLAPSGMSLEDI